MLQLILLFIYLINYILLMEFEQMEMDDIDNYNKLDKPICKKSKSKKVHQKSSISKKIAIGAIFVITLFAFVFFNYLNNNNLNNSISLEKNEKNENQKLSNTDNKCEPGYKLENGNCVINYSFKATYKIYNKDKLIPLIHSIKSEGIKEMYVNGEKVQPSNTYLFPEKGTYTVHFLLDESNLDSLSHMFDGIIHLESISFSEKFNSEKIVKMDNMFRNCKSLIDVDLSKFNTKNVKEMQFMFFGCTALLSLD